MSSYYANNEIEAYEAQRADYDERLASYQNAVEKAQAAHDAWEADPIDDDGNPIPEPTPPEEIEVPTPPEPPPLYSTREVTALEEIETAFGPALVTPGRLVVTDPAGAAWAVGPEELAAGYTAVEAAALPGSAKRAGSTKRKRAARPSARGRSK